MAITYIESGKHFFGEQAEDNQLTTSVLRLCSSAPVSTTNTNELSGGGYVRQSLHVRLNSSFLYDAEEDALVNNMAISFPTASADWEPVTHILLSSDSSLNDGISFELSSAITVRRGDTLIFESGSLKIGLSRIYDGVGAAATFILASEAHVNFNDNNFVNRITTRGVIHIKLLTGEPTLTDTKETVPDFPAGVEIKLDSAGDPPRAFYENSTSVLYGPFASGATFTHYAVGYSLDLAQRAATVTRVTPHPFYVGVFNMYGYEALASPIVIPADQNLFIPANTIRTSQAALT